MPSSTNVLGQIKNQVMWSRLIALVEEQAQMIIRTAFSTTVRESGDLSAGVFDVKGRMMAQAVTGTPGHVNAMCDSIPHFLKKIPTESIRPGDHYITNDPWLGTGHLHDLTIVTPAFHKGKLVGFFANVAHVTDIGGVGMGPEGRSVFEEGLYIPILKCFDQERPNETFFEFIRAGSRRPEELEGDVYSLSACNSSAAKRLTEMMSEFGIDTLDGLADFIFDNSLEATRAAIREVPNGAHSASLTTEGYDGMVVLSARMTIRDEEIAVDFTGTSGPSMRGINVPAPYTKAYACFGIKVAVAPHVPNNWASLLPFVISFPEEACILNAQHPAPVCARHVIGQLVPDVMIGCLYHAIPDKVMAEGSSTLWDTPLRGGVTYSGSRPDGRNLEDFEIMTFNSGGMGARAGMDGLHATAFPSGVKSTPVEITENMAPIIIWQKELRPDSGGAGRMQGGCGQIMEIGSKGDLEFGCQAVFARVTHPAKGRNGGDDGACGSVFLRSGAKLKPIGLQKIPDSDRLVLLVPGGGGFGPANERPQTLVERDIRDGLLSESKAKDKYTHIYK